MHTYVCFAPPLQEIPMSAYKFSESLSLANKFAVHLLSGTVNMQIDYDSPDMPLVDVKYEESWFSTDVVSKLKIMFYDYELSKIEATDISKNPDSIWSEGEIRHISVFVRNRHRIEELIATFDVARDFLDGDEVVGWTRWRVQRVRIRPDSERQIELVSERINRDDEYFVWGRRICSTT